MKYLILFLTLTGCIQTSGSETEDIKAEIALGAIASISQNELGVDFLGTTCIGEINIYCDAPLHETTSTARLTHLVDEFVDNSPNFITVEERLYERKTLYRNGEIKAEVHFIVEHKRLRLIVVELI